MISTETATITAWARPAPGRAGPGDERQHGDGQHRRHEPARRPCRPGAASAPGERCASATSSTICCSVVSAPTARHVMTKLPRPLSVPPVTGSPACFSTGIDSPVSIDSSTALPPSTTMPSTGTLSPGRTRSRSPTATSSSGTSCSSPVAVDPPARSRARGRAARGWRRPVRSRALSSSTWPSSTSVDDHAPPPRNRGRRCRARRGTPPERARGQDRDHAVEPGDAGADARSA